MVETRKASIIVFGGEKGGTGKTSLATNIAAMLATEKKDVLIMDTDRQGTASFWTAVRNEDQNLARVSCVQQFGKGLPAQIIDLATRYTHIIIDAGGRDSMELRYALGVADTIYIPIQPFQFDIWTVRQMDELVEKAQAINSKLKAKLIFNRVPTNSSLKEEREAKSFIKEENFQFLELLDGSIKDRISFRKAARAGRSVVEMNVDEKGTNEIKKLYGEIYGW